MVRPSLSATGFRLSDCSYTVLVKVSASSEYLADSLVFFSSAAISGLASSSDFWLAGTSLVTLTMW
jgi:hypothetical protein